MDIFSDKKIKTTNNGYYPYIQAKFGPKTKFVNAKNDTYVIVSYITR